MYLVRSPWWLRACFRGCVWKIPTHEKVVHLTFDDGPTPGVTDWVLQQLDSYGFGATFFLIGSNIEKHPALLQKLQESGHSLGNHTYTHPNGWQTPLQSYLHEFERCNNLLSSNLFRPPYGRITRAQAKAIRATHRIIMWDIVSGDFDTSIGGERCYQNVVRNISPGSIIVFHDSEKAEPRLRYALPRVLKYLQEKGYRSAGL